MTITWIKTEYKGTVIEVKNSPNKCSLFVDGKTEDFYTGLFVRGDKILKAMCNGVEIKAIVKNKFTHAKVEVYYNNRLLEKKIVFI
ncbi:MAG: hypothetical protein ACLR4X_11425 [Clostridia bacterium]